MKVLVNIIRFAVGLLFIFSGLVKANDPLGLSYKMQEFFERWNEDLAGSSFFLKNGFLSLIDFFDHYSLALAIIMITFEIVAGVALILGWKWKLFSWLMLILIIFFTFLTGYAVSNPKFRNCGCFGDCIPITTKTSFYKDIILTILILFLFLARKHIKPFLSHKANVIAISLATLLTLGLQWYTLAYLPLVDCLPYKKGNSIIEGRKMPANAVQDVYDMRFVYSKNGKEYEFKLEELPADIDTYKFVDQKKKLVKKGTNNEPKITGFTLKGVTGTDSTNEVLDQQYAILLLSENFNTPVSSWGDDFKTLAEQGKQKNIPVYILTASLNNGISAMQTLGLADIQVLTCDYTAIRSAARINPTAYLLNKGIVVEKRGYRELDHILSAISDISMPKPLPPTSVTDSTTAQ